MASKLILAKMLKVKFVADQTIPRITDVFKKQPNKNGLKIKIVDDTQIDIMQDLKELTLGKTKVRINLELYVHHS